MEHLEGISDEEEYIEDARETSYRNSRHNNSVASSTLQYVIDSLFSGEEEESGEETDNDDEAQLPRREEKSEREQNIEKQLHQMSKKLQYWRSKTAPAFSPSVSEKSARRRSSLKPTRDVVIEEEPYVEEESETEEIHEEEEEEAEEDEEIFQQKPNSSMYKSEESVVTLEKELRRTKEEVKWLKEVILQSKEERQQREEKIKERERKLADLQKQLHSLLRQREKEIRINNKVQEKLLMNQEQKKKTTKERTQTETILMQEIQQKNQTIKSMQEEMKTLKQLVQTQQQKADMLQKERDVEIKAMRDMYETKVSEFIDKEHQMSIKINELSEQFSEQASKLGKLGEENTRMSAEMQAKNTEVSHLEKLVKELKNREAEWRNTNKHYTELQKNHGEVTSKYNELRLANQTLESEKKELLNANAQYTHQLKEIESAYTNDTSALTSQLEEGKRKISLLEQKMKEFKKLYERDRENAKARNAQIEQVSKENVQLVQALKEVQEELKKAQSEKQIQLSTAEEVLNKKVEEVLERERKQKELIRDSQKRIQELEMEVCNIKTQSKDESSELVNKLQESKRRIEELESDLLKAKKKIEAELQTRLQQNTKVKQFELECEKMAKIIEREKKLREEYEHQIAELESNLSVYKEMYDAMSEENSNAAQYTFARKRQIEIEKDFADQREKLRIAFQKAKALDELQAELKQQLDKVKKSEKQLRVYLTSMLNEFKAIKDEKDERVAKIAIKTQAMERENSLNHDQVLNAQSTLEHCDSELKDYKTHLASLLKDMNSQSKSLEELKKAFKQFKNALPQKHEEEEEDLHGVAQELPSNKSPTVIVRRNSLPANIKPLESFEDSDETHSELSTEPEEPRTDLPSAEPKDFTNQSKLKTKKKVKKVKAATPSSVSPSLRARPTTHISKKTAPTTSPQSSLSQLANELKQLQTQKAVLLRKAKPVSKKL